MIYSGSWEIYLCWLCLLRPLFLHFQFYSLLMKTPNEQNKVKWFSFALCVCVCVCVCQSKAKYSECFIDLECFTKCLLLQCAQYCCLQSVSVFNFFSSVFQISKIVKTWRYSWMPLLLLFYPQVQCHFPCACFLLQCLFQCRLRSFGPHVQYNNKQSSFLLIPLRPCIVHNMWTFFLQMEVLLPCFQVHTIRIWITQNNTLFVFNITLKKDNVPILFTLQLQWWKLIHGT